MISKYAEIFVRDMEKSIRSINMAESMIRLWGMQGIEIVNQY